jgi:hypothetical protein
VGRGGGDGGGTPGSMLPLRRVLLKEKDWRSVEVSSQMVESNSLVQQEDFDSAREESSDRVEEESLSYIVVNMLCVSSLMRNSLVQQEDFDSAREESSDREEEESLSYIIVNMLCVSSLMFAFDEILFVINKKMYAKQHRV